MIPFANELIGPLHRESFRRDGAAPGPNDVAIEAYGCMIDRPLIEGKLAGLDAILAQRIPEERRRRGQRGKVAPE